MGEPEHIDLQAIAAAVLRRVGDLWEFPQLAETTRVEVSTRMTRSLARVRPDTRVIRIARPVVEGPQASLEEVICHEAAHIVAHSQATRRIRPHGREWAALMERAGYPARARVDARLLGITMPAGPGRGGNGGRGGRGSGRRKKYVYDHRCPVCQNHRTSGRVVRSWRCGPCVDAGMKGELVVTRFERVGRGGRSRQAGLAKLTPYAGLSRLRRLFPGR
ncbi:SprT-like domain-containing protein [Candidatus Binatia bacterium]|nr:SprT-like domain-containing protein [Candidatus Binatia bacterium]